MDINIHRTRSRNELPETLSILDLAASMIGRRRQRIRELDPKSLDIVSTANFEKFVAGIAILDQFGSRPNPHRH
jgi:hypothetical protein